MSDSRRQAVTAGATVVVGAAMSVVTNLVTDGWPVVLVVVLAVLVVVGVLLAVLPLRPFPVAAPPGRKSRVLHQRARASRGGTIVQVGGDVVVPRPESPPDGGAERRGRPG